MRNRGTDTVRRETHLGTLESQVRIVQSHHGPPVAGSPNNTQRPRIGFCVKFEEILASFPKVRDVGLEKRRAATTRTRTTFIRRPWSRSYWSRVLVMHAMICGSRNQNRRRGEPEFH
jgi:hypothetical protein